MCCAALFSSLMVAAVIQWTGSDNIYIKAPVFRVRIITVIFPAYRATAGPCLMTYCITQLLIYITQNQQSIE